MKSPQVSPRARRRCYSTWNAGWLVVFLSMFLYLFDTATIWGSAQFRLTINAQSPANEPQPQVVVSEDDRPGCPVRPIFLTPEDIDTSDLKGTVPDHVIEFDKKGIKLPRYARSEIYMVSVTSNKTHWRRIAQNNTFGRMFEIRSIGLEHFPVCVLCEKEDLDNSCHCPGFKKTCSEDVFFQNNQGWWCATRRQILAVQLAVAEFENMELPKWLYLLDDNTFVNPISLMLLLTTLDPDIPYWIGDDWDGFLGGGSGKLISRSMVKLLMGPPVVPTITYHWPNGTHSVTAQTQLESCMARWQGGDWCYYHGDWGLGECMNELGIALTGVSTKDHVGFFSQLLEKDLRHRVWFHATETWVADVLRHTHSIGIHTDDEQMFDIFYKVIVPFYQGLPQFQ